MSNCDALIDALVRKINDSPHRRIREEDIPLRLRDGGAEFGLYYDWTILRSNDISWIDPLDAFLPAPLPPSYKSLVSRYLFPAFEVSPLILLANTGHDLYHEMSAAMTRDKVLSDILLKNGYAQFARPDTGDADPVCFDFNRQKADGECPIVRISHHTILLNSLAQVINDISPSFEAFVHDILAAEIIDVRKMVEVRNR